MTLSNKTWRDMEEREHFCIEEVKQFIKRIKNRMVETHTKKLHLSLVDALEIIYQEAGDKLT